MRSHSCHCSSVVDNNGYIQITDTHCWDGGMPKIFQQQTMSFVFTFPPPPPTPSEPKPSGEQGTNESSHLMGGGGLGFRWGGGRGTHMAVLLPNPQHDTPPLHEWVSPGLVGNCFPAADRLMVRS